MIKIPYIVAFLAPIVNCVQLVPQLYKTYITKSVGDLSFYSLLLILSTNFLWLLHGYFIQDMALIVASFIAFSINITLFFLFLMYRHDTNNQTSLK